MVWRAVLLEFDAPLPALPPLSLPTPHRVPLHLIEPY